MKRLTDLLQWVLTDVSINCKASVYRDMETTMKRCRNEGLSFLTITLPNFAKALEKALERGYWLATDLPMFKQKHRRSSLPAFLQGLTSQIFDDLGVLHGTPSVQAIDGIRQVCYLFSKTGGVCSEARSARAVDDFKTCEAEMAQFRVQEISYLKQVVEVFEILYGDWCQTLDSDIKNHEPFLPKHGPGTTENGVKGNAKYNAFTWTRRLERYFPSRQYLFTTCEEYVERVLGPIRSRLPGLIHKVDEPAVRVVMVPKTVKAPRVIAIEPVHMQYVQQSICREFTAFLESHRLTKGHVNFADQTINRTHALASSKSGDLSTLDLSEASDRVHSAVVAVLFRKYPTLMKGIFACRTSKAKLPDDTVIVLRKFASMGSALCFPIEAMVFFTLMTFNRLRSCNHAISKRNVFNATRQLYVYGDDLILPSHEVISLTGILQDFGLKVNPNKTFFRGKFRESCGLDAYDGVQVTPVRLRHYFPETRKDHTEIVSIIATTNLFYKKGMWNTVKALRNYVEGLVGMVPHVADDSSILGWQSFSQYSTVDRWNTQLHRFEVKGFYPKPRKYVDELDGYRALLKFFLQRRGDKPLSLEDYQRSVLRGSVQLKTRWAPIS